MVMRFTAWGLGINWALGIYFWALYLFPPQDPLAKVQWFCVGLIESWGLVFSMACNLLTMDKSFAEITAAVLIIILVMLWLVHRFTQARRKLNEQNLNL